MGRRLICFRSFSRAPSLTEAIRESFAALRRLVLQNPHISVAYQRLVHHHASAWEFYVDCGLNVCLRPFRFVAERHATVGVEIVLRVVPT